MNESYPQLLIADKKGRIRELKTIEALAMKAGIFFKLTRRNLIRLPQTSRLFILPQRVPVGYDNKNGCLVHIDRDPFSKAGKMVFGVAAFLPPGYTLTYNSAYREVSRIKMLPLFAYAPVVFYKGALFTTAVRVDKEKRQDERLMNIERIKKNILKLRKLFKKNRLFGHLANCALTYNCPAAKNFFLSRYEAPLPSSPFCNARCAGCISYQPQKRCPITQPRIKFSPGAEEIADIALYHIEGARDPIVSFGQGCEGEPLLRGEAIEKAIVLIRKTTRKGIINLNTNASRPKTLAKLFDAGLDSMRVSLNSLQSTYYNRYYEPKGYRFKDVLRSISTAKAKGGFVSLNYLIMPGFTDSKLEFSALRSFLETQPIDMIQWRNLNFDPLAYLREIKFSAANLEMLGIREIIVSLKRAFPHIIRGYFNPSKARIRRSSL